MTPAPPTPALKYPGAKWRLAPWILEHMPPHQSYLEPFFGSGAVLFNKPRAKYETVNDLDGGIVQFFRVCREQPEALEMTPWAREEERLRGQVERLESAMTAPKAQRLTGMPAGDAGDAVSVVRCRGCKHRGRRNMPQGAVG